MLNNVYSSACIYEVCEADDPDLISQYGLGNSKCDYTMCNNYLMTYVVHFGPSPAQCMMLIDLKIFISYECNPVLLDPTCILLISIPCLS